MFGESEHVGEHLKMLGRTLKMLGKFYIAHEEGGLAGSIATERCGWTFIFSKLGGLTFLYTTVSILFYFKLSRTVRDIEKTSNLRLLVASTATGNILISTFLITARHGLYGKTAGSTQVGRAPGARQGRRCHLPNQQEKALIAGLHLALRLASTGFNAPALA